MKIAGENAASANAASAAHSAKLRAGEALRVKGMLAAADGPLYKAILTKRFFGTSH